MGSPGEAGVDAGGQQIVVKMHQVADGSAPVSLQRRGGLIGNVAQGVHGFFDAPALFRADIAPVQRPAHGGQGNPRGLGHVLKGYVVHASPHM